MKINAKVMSTGLIYAALYAALTIGLSPISYGAIQVRLADVLVAAVPLFGWAGVLGQGLGVFIANIPSPLGWIDMLNAIPSAVMALAMVQLYKRCDNRSWTVIVGAIAYSAVIAVSVGYMLSTVYGLPEWITSIYVFIGNIVATVAIGFPVFLAIRRTGIFQKYGFVLGKQKGNGTQET